MRIADHAPVLQGSPILQQPANAVHQQQVLAPEAARAAALAQAQQHSTQVFKPGETEGRTIGDATDREGQSNRGRARSEPRAEEVEGKEHLQPSTPGSGDLLDIVV